MKLLFLLAALLLLSLPVQAKPAKCYSTDDGYYRCHFRAHSGNGSFTITAPGYPSYNLDMFQRGRGYGSANYGTGRWVPLPGVYIRSRKDRACWISNATATQICAW